MLSSVHSTLVLTIFGGIFRDLFRWVKYKIFHDTPIGGWFVKFLLVVFFLLSAYFLLIIIIKLLKQLFASKLTKAATKIKEFESFLKKRGEDFETIKAESQDKLKDLHKLNGVNETVLFYINLSGFLGLINCHKSIIITQFRISKLDKITECVFWNEISDIKEIDENYYLIVYLKKGLEMEFKLDFNDLNIKKTDAESINQFRNLLKSLTQICS